MRRLRILVVSEPMEYGVLSYLERLFEGLDRSRWEPALAFSPYRMAPQARRLVASLVEQGIRVRSLPLRRGAGVGDAAAAVRLLAEIRAFEPDIVHLHSTKAGLIGRAAASVLGVGVLYTPHGTSWRYTGRTIGRVQLALERAFRRATDLLVSVCPEEAAAFVNEVGFHPGRIRVVPNGVRLPDGAALAALRGRVRAALGVSAGEVVGVFVGRLTREKGLDVLLRALGAGSALDGLLVVGDGPERGRLEAEGVRVGLPVRFCGYHEDVSGFLAAADVFVQPSRSEGLPFSVLEAMAHGLPVVGSDVGGMQGAIDGCGRLVPPDDPPGLARCLDQVARDPALRRALGEAGRARVAREFGVPAMLRALHGAYEEASDCRQRARGGARRVEARVVRDGA
jgi:glycosyltransferase involved in cell wall biosynthesis